jgi:hypothetical protein
MQTLMERLEKILDCRLHLEKLGIEEDKVMERKSTLRSNIRLVPGLISLVLGSVSLTYALSNDVALGGLVAIAVGGCAVILYLALREPLDHQ